MASGDGHQMFVKAQIAFGSGKTLNLDFRLKQLKNLLRFYTESHEEIIQSLRNDLRKTRLEAVLYEIEVLKQDLNDIIKNFKKYTSNEYLPLNGLACLDRGYIKKDPYGVVLILGTWNYPISMTLLPLNGAIAAGCCVILKPSEVAPHSASTMAKLIPKYLDKECYQVFQGGVEETKELLTNKFDYIFATGSTQVGKSIAKQAAENLIPTTLELGGKSPVYIDEHCDFKLAAKRILWGKCMNLGQTCIAPDFVLCTKKVEKEFIKKASEVMIEWYGSNPKESEHIPRIINDRHFMRLKNILEKTKGVIAFGGDTDRADLWIAPTIIVDIDKDDAIMKEEIFGPLLPFITVNSPDEAIKLILSRPKPLSLYIFSNEQSIIDKFLEKTSSGGVCVNDVMWQNGWYGLPFGGVGESGMGNYHSKFSVDTFSHKKSILIRGFSFLSEKLGEARYPPYTQGKINFFTFVIRYFDKFNIGFSSCTTHTFAFALGAFILYWFMKYFGN